MVSTDGRTDGRTDRRTDTEGYNIIPRHTLVAGYNKLKDASFVFSMTNITILSIFRTHAQKEYRKVSKMKGTYILNILALLLLENLQRIY